MTDSQQGVKAFDRIRACTDQGSGNVKIRCQYVPAGQSPDDTEAYPIVPVRLTSFANASTVPLRVLFDGGIMYLGSKVDEHLRRFPHLSDRVIEQFKLVLCPEYSNEDVVGRVYRGLGMAQGDLGEIQVLYTHLFDFCPTEIRAFMRSFYRGLDKADKEWDAMSIELQITVPVMWGGAARGVMVNAAKDAGFTDIVLRSEPLCAAARYVYQEYEHRRVKADEVLTFIDIGRGTGDISTVQVHRPQHVKGKPRLSICCPSDGGLVGSQRVNDLAWTDLISQTEEQDFRRLGIDRANAHQQFTREFEKIKVQYAEFPASSYGYSVIFYGSRADQGEELWPLRISHDQMKGWFESAAAEVCALLDRHLDRSFDLEVKACIVAGGGAKNTDTVDVLRGHLQKRGIELRRYNELFHYDDDPVAHGALLLYLESPQTTLPEYLTLYYARGGDSTASETFGLEAEASVSQRSIPGNNPRAGANVQANLSAATRSLLADASSDEILLPMFTQTPNRRPRTQLVEVEFPIKARERRTARLRFSIYSSERNTRSHKSAYDSAGQLKPGLTEWPLAFEDLPDLESVLGYKLEKGSSGKRCYVKVLVGIYKADDRLEVRAKVLDRWSKFPSHMDAGFSMEQRLQQVNVRLVLSKDIWASNASHELSSGGENISTGQRGKRPHDEELFSRSKMPRIETPTPLGDTAVAGPSNYNTRRSTMPAPVGTRLRHSSYDSPSGHSDYYPNSCSSREKSASAEFMLSNTKRVANRALEVFSTVSS